MLKLLIQIRKCLKKYSIIKWSSRSMPQQYKAKMKTVLRDILILFSGLIFQNVILPDSLRIIVFLNFSNILLPNCINNYIMLD